MKLLRNTRRRLLSGILGASLLLASAVLSFPAAATASQTVTVPYTAVTSGTADTADTPGAAIPNSESAYTYETNAAGTAVITSYNGSSPSVALPRTVRGIPVVGIADGVFASHTEIVRVDIPEGLVSIGARAFEGCTSLLTLTLPDSVTHIGDGAFRGCSSLYFADVGDSLISLGASAFEGCAALDSLTLPETLESVGSAAFSGCTALRDLVLLTKSLASLPTDALPGGVTLYSPGEISLGEGVSHVTLAASGSGAVFTYERIVGGVEITSCRTSAGAVVVPSKIGNSPVVSIGDNAFRENCSALRAVVLSKSVNSIGKSAFRGLGSLSYVRMPDSLTLGMGAECFSGCSSLRSIMIPDGTATVSMNTFFACGSLERVTLPESLKRILSGAFSGCVSLSQLYFQGDEPDCDGKSGPVDMLAFGAVPSSMTVFTLEGRNWQLSSLLWYPNGRPSDSVGYVRRSLSVGCFFAESDYRAASCTAEGVRRFTCPFCGESYEETSPLLEHEFVSVGTNDGVETFRCLHCTENYTLRHIEACEIQPTFDITKQGTDVIQGLEVRFRGTLLTADVDYTYTVALIGEYSRIEITVLGMGGYTGSEVWGYSYHTGDALKRYTVSVSGADGGGEYYRDDIVTLTPSVPVPEGYRAVWVADGVQLRRADNTCATFSMPARAVSVTLTLERLPETTPPETTPPEPPTTTVPETPTTTEPSTSTPGSDTTAPATPAETTTREPYNHTQQGEAYMRTAILWGVVLFCSLAAFVGLCVAMFRKKK